MRKTTIFTSLFIVLTLTLTQLVGAEWKYSTVINQTDETLLIISSTHQGKTGAIPAGYRTVGYIRILAGQQKQLKSWANSPIYLQIRKGMDPIKPKSSTQTLSFWIHQSKAFTIVTKRPLNVPVLTGDFLYANRNRNEFVERDSFVAYTNGSTITVTNTWVDVDVESLTPNARVNIPDPSLRTAIEVKLGKDENAPISEADMLTLEVLTLDPLTLEIDIGIPSELRIADLSGLEFATNLRQLDLWDNNISDVSHLKNLVNLETLHLNNNSISE